MQMVKYTSQKMIEQFYLEMPPLFFEKEFQRNLNDAQIKFGFSDSTKSRLKKKAKKLDLVWNSLKSSGVLYSFNKESVTELDILAAWTAQKGCYLSHYTALYFNELVDQRPKDYFITCEKVGKSAGAGSTINPFSIRQAFLKPARKTNNFFLFNEYKFYLLEKVWLDSIGVIEKTSLSPTKRPSVRVTSIERTFIDCIIAPQYSGGLVTTYKAFQNSEIDISNLFTIYEKLNPVYPYWQSIGFFLDQLDLKIEAQKWKNLFDERKMVPFYLEHEAKSSWKFSDKWSIFYPGGIFAKA